MKEDKQEPKIVMSEKGKCPYCGKYILIEKTRTMIQPGQAAKYQDTFKIEKDTQQKLK